MRLVFLGNGPFARPILEQLLDAGRSVAAVVTRPDRPQGKHLEIIPGPVKLLAEQAGLPVHQPADANALEFIDVLRSLQPDLLVVADFGQILSSDCLASARLGGINVHGSLLPKYRGAAPVAWAIYHGQTETGVTIIAMSAKMDAGGIILQERVPISDSVTAGELEAELAVCGARLAVQAVDLIEKGKQTIIPQDSASASRAPKLRKEDGLIDWSRSARQIHDQVRAMLPWPIAFTYLDRSKRGPLRVQILQTEIREEGTSLQAAIARPAHEDDATLNLAPGAIRAIEADRLIVQTGNGRLALLELKPAGKSAQPAAAFARGYRLAPGDRFVSVQDSS